MKVLLIGSYPPPLGGVSIFLQRYKAKLEGEGHFVEVLDPTKLANLRVLSRLVGARARCYDLISLNYPSLRVIRVLAALGLAEKTEYWDHNWRVQELWSRQSWSRAEAFMKSCRDVFLVSEEIRNSYTALGIHLPEKTRIRNAFLPPDESNIQEVLESYPQEVTEFINRCRPLIVANAFKLILQNGTDLYGLDLCVELIDQLKNEYPNAGLLFALADIGDRDYYERTCKRIAELELNNRFCVLTGQREFWPLLKQAQLMVRPTLTDGYALSVAEAIHFGCTVVASDATSRPEQVITFRNRDPLDFVQKCRSVLAAENRHDPLR